MVSEKRKLPTQTAPPSSLQNEATTHTLDSLSRTVSPPPLLPTPKRRKLHIQPQISGSSKSAAAAVEAGEKHVTDHLAFYSSHLLRFIRPADTGPRLSHAAWIDLYTRNAGSVTGCHFVIHQHDHPVAGTHYDLRLQCNPTSSISFAIMYGLPGNPNSRRLNRNAMETRVHCLWNHLVETASLSTGSLLLWDTGEYEVLPYEKADEKEKVGYVTTDDEDEDDAEEDYVGKLERSTDGENEQQKLKSAFQRRKMRLRLHGTRLPKGYTLSLRMTKDNFRSEQPKAPVRRRRHVVVDPHGSETDSDRNSDDRSSPPKRRLSSLSRLESPPRSHSEKHSGLLTQSEDAAAVASDNEEEIVRENNAYIGATNDIGSIHQRRWYLSMDRASSGFVKKTIQSKGGLIDTIWLPRTENSLYQDGFEKFIVGGRNTERSVLTSRLASDILSDEGVVGYIPRGLWRAVTE